MTLLTNQDPETWKPGDVREIPTVRGYRNTCTITRITPSFVEFIGPTGPGNITRELYMALQEKGLEEEFSVWLAQHDEQVRQDLLAAARNRPKPVSCSARRFNQKTNTSTGCTRRKGHTGHHSHNGRVVWDQ